MLNLKTARVARDSVDANPLFQIPISRDTSKQPFSPTVVEWLVKKNIVTIPVVQMAVEFFGVLYLRDVVSMRGNPSEAFDPIRNRKTLFFPNATQSAWYLSVADLADETLVFLDEFMFTYLCAATAGELRHAQAHANANTTALKTWKILINGAVVSRSETQKNFLLAMTPDKSAAYLQDAVKIFGGGGWSSSFGGKKWAAIAKTGLDRIEGKLDATIFVDRVFDLKHNGGPMFDKNSVINQDSLPTFLDDKLHLKSDNQWGTWLGRGTQKLLGLVQRAQELGLWTGKVPAAPKFMSASLTPILKGPPGSSPAQSPAYDHVVSKTDVAPDFPTPSTACPKGKVVHNAGG